MVVLLKIMGLKAAKKLFADIHETCPVHVADHALKDHPERVWTYDELLQLVRDGQQLVDNKKVDNPIPESWLLKVKDIKKRKCEIAFLFEEEKRGIIIIAVKHAYRNMGEIK